MFRINLTFRNEHASLECQYIPMRRLAKKVAMAFSMRLLSRSLNVTAYTSGSGENCAILLSDKRSAPRGIDPASAIAANR